MPKEYEYNEGPKARENFERGMKSLFQVRKRWFTPHHKTQKETGMPVQLLLCLSSED